MVKPSHSSYTEIPFTTGQIQQVLGANPLRRAVYIAPSTSVTINVMFGNNAPTQAGMLVGLNQLPLKLTYEDIGDLITMPIAVKNNGGGNATIVVCETIRSVD